MDMDINAFIEEQQLEMDPEVAELLNEDTTAAAKKKGGKKKGKKAATVDDGDKKEVVVDHEDGEAADVVVEMDEEDELELAAYMESLKSQAKDDENDDDQLVEKVYANNTVGKGPMD